MQEDKQLKDLLAQWGMEQPAAGFADGVMRQVTLLNQHRHSPVATAPRLPQLLAGAFVLVCMLLLALSFTLPAVTLPLRIDISEKIYSQAFAFIAAFWVVLLGSLAAKKYLATGL